ncbi:MAG: thiamine pyrophosphate-dependent enzyme [Terracidiphilus sp.]
MTARFAPQPASPHPAALPAPFSLISPERLWEIYAAMLRCRAIAERAAELVRAGIPAHSLQAALGCEAAYAAVLVGLHSADVLSSAAEDTVAGFLHGLPLKALFAALAPPLAPPAHTRPKKAELAPQPSPQPTPPLAKLAGLLPLAPSPAAQLHLANGAAFALKPQANKPLVVALCGSGAAPDEAWQQALDFAGAHTLPILFLCLSQASDAAALAEANAHFDQLFTLAGSARVPTIVVDAQDAVAVYRVASESISRARLRRGPTLIACFAHPTQHVPGYYQSGRKSSPGQTAGDHTDSGDGLRAMEAYLGRKAFFDPARKAQILDAFARQLDRATRGLPR